LIGIKRKIILLLVTAGPAGYFPVAPGTCGTLIAVPFSLALNRLATFSIALALVALVGFISGAIWLSGKGAAIVEQKDPSVIVIDEIAGFLLANFLAPFGKVSLLLAFVLFRFFDIAKIYPASRIEKLPGGKGIVLDDVVAGLYCFSILQLLKWWELI